MDGNKDAVTAGRDQPANHDGTGHVFSREPQCAEQERSKEPDADGRHMDPHDPTVARARKLRVEHLRLWRGRLLGL